MTTYDWTHESFSMWYSPAQIRRHLTRDRRSVQRIMGPQPQPRDRRSVQRIMGPQPQPPWYRRIWRWLTELVWRG